MSERKVPRPTCKAWRFYVAPAVWKCNVELELQLQPNKTKLLYGLMQ